MLEPTKSVLQSKWSRFLKNICISVPFFLKFTVSILWEKFCNKPNLETAIARYKFLFQEYMPHSFGVNSQDESDRRLRLCHVCFSTLLSQHWSVCTRLKLKIQERTFTKSGGVSSIKCRWSAGQNFSSARLTYFSLNQIIGKKICSIDVCLKTLQLYGNSKTAIYAQLWKQRCSTLNHFVYSVLMKHLLHKRQILF